MRDLTPREEGNCYINYVSLDKDWNYRGITEVEADIVDFCSSPEHFYNQDCINLCYQKIEKDTFPIKNIIDAGKAIYTKYLELQTPELQKIAPSIKIYLEEAEQLVNSFKDESPEPRLFRIGDVVRFKDVKKIGNEEYYVFNIFENERDKQKDEICLILRNKDNIYYNTYCLERTKDVHEARQLEIVKKCPYKNNDKIPMKAVYWDSWHNKFVIDDIIGTFRAGTYHDGVLREENGLIKFNKKVFDIDRIYYPLLGTIYGSRIGEAIFCLATKEEVKKAQEKYLNMLTFDMDNYYQDFLRKAEERARAKEAIIEFDASDF